MQRSTFYTGILAGTLGLGTLGLFYNGAQALDLGEFTGADRALITQEAPKAGGIVLVTERQIQQQAQQRPATAAAHNNANGPMLTGVSYNAITPAAGATGNVAVGDGSTGVPGRGIGNNVDVTTMPGNSFDQVRARFAATGGAAADSVPVDGKPLTTDTLANGTRVEENLDAIIPAAGGAAQIKGGAKMVQQQEPQPYGYNR